jgi:predicted nucleic acid-binding protein
VILADTSVWIDHFRSGNSQMQARLNRGEIAIHPFIIAELALGSLKQRARTLALLDLLPHIRVALAAEVRTAIKARNLYGVGIGLVDAHLIASVLIDPSIRLWTHDKKLRQISERLGIHAE